MPGSAVTAGFIDFGDAKARHVWTATGLSVAESNGCWTDGPEASVAFKIPSDLNRDVVIKITANPFVARHELPVQIVTTRVKGVICAKWEMRGDAVRTYALVVEKKLIQDGAVKLDFEIPNCASPQSLGMSAEARHLGIKLRSMKWQALRPKPNPWLFEYGRPVGIEAGKSFDEKIESGFWERFIRGPAVLDIGYRGRADWVVPITPTATGVDLDYPGYDGRILPFADRSQDAVYASHCLEHIPDPIAAIREWHRVTKLGGHIIMAVPHAHLYERASQPPSKWNHNHVRFYTPASLLAEVEMALPPNSYRIRYLDDNDAGYSYELSPDIHPVGCYEIELVLERIRPPAWSSRK